MQCQPEDSVLSKLACQVHQHFQIVQGEVVCGCLMGSKVSKCSISEFLTHDLQNSTVGIGTHNAKQMLQTSFVLGELKHRLFFLVTIFFVFRFFFKHNVTEKKVQTKQGQIDFNKVKVRKK